LKLHPSYASVPLFCALLSACGGGDDPAQKDVALSAHRGDGERPALVVGDPATACPALAGTEISASQIALPTRGGSVQTATLTPATTNGDPEYCRVRGQVLSADPAAPALNFQLNLPSTWVRRSMQLGGGGFNGSVVTGTGNVPGTTGANAPVTPLRRNYATFGSDGGVSGGPAGSFGLNAEAFANYSGESVKRTRDAAQFLIRAYYGEAPKHQYYAGGSKGGHEGLVAAQRYGDDYDGIISYYPAKTHLWMIYGWENIRRAVAAPGGALNNTKQTLVINAVNAACDGLDGLVDGVIANRKACDQAFDINTLACPGGGDTGNTCLSSAQINTVRSAASSVPLPFPEESNTMTGPFPALHGGNIVATLGSYQLFNVGVIRYWYLQNPAATNAEVATFDFVANRPAIEPVIRQFNATDPNIDRFLSGGGKLIMVQGTTDMLVPSTTTDPYYEALVARYQGRVRNTVRYYVQPGYGHGSGVFGLSYDSLTALDDWVTKGAAPANQIAYDGNTATAGRSMPLCDYPAWPRYGGDGDPKLASSFKCVE
jgi:hypothetical protein